MNLQSFKNIKGLIILISALAILLFYTVDIFKLSYRLEDWQTFGEMPVAVREVQYFMADTPNLIGYPEPGSGTTVSCSTSVAYVETASGETYRCCDTRDKISCLAGNFSNEIPVVDEECTDSLKQAFSIPDNPAYQFYGSCSDADAIQLTIVQLDDSGQILWKFLNVEDIQLSISTLRCVVAPLLFILIIVILIMAARSIPKEPIPRF